MTIYRKIKSIFRDIKLKQRMQLVYLFGCIIPLVFVNLYMYNGTKKVLLDQAKENEVGELRLIADSIESSMDISADVSKRLYFNDDIEKIAFHKYSNYSEILEDYRNSTAISDYLKYYYQDIASISVYVNNETISDNEYFKFATSKIKEKGWYRKTMEYRGAPVWSYQTDVLTGNKRIRLTRVLYTESLNMAGIISITLQNKVSEAPIHNRPVNTMLIYNNKEVIHSNYQNDNYSEIIDLVRERGEEEFCGRIEYQGEKCLLTYIKIQPDYSNDYYSLVSIQSYNDIVAAATKNSLSSLVPMTICIIITLILITVFTDWFSKRVNVFKDTMHKAATGDFNIDEGRITGKDEIGMLYDDLNSMITDIQQLMITAVEERVQKEQVYSRQKDVEFKMLASQINPHFLYNTLETIRMIARVNDQPDIEELTRMLTKLLRRNIQVGHDLQTLKSELELVECYMKIQNYRFMDRITSRIEVNNEDIDGLMVMPLLVQPFVENAFVHGMENKESDGEILVKVEVIDDVYIYIQDNGCGMSEEELRNVIKYLNDFENLDRTHIGICNVNQRIKLKYGEEYGVVCISEENIGTKITIKLPAIYKE